MIVVARRVRCAVCAATSRECCSRIGCVCSTAGPEDNPVSPGASSSTAATATVTYRRVPPTGRLFVRPPRRPNRSHSGRVARKNNVSGARAVSYSITTIIYVLYIIRERERAHAHCINRNKRPRYRHRRRTLLLSAPG